jgi:hypothetical protein
MEIEGQELAVLRSMDRDCTRSTSTRSRDPTSAGSSARTT